MKYIIKNCPAKYFIFADEMKCSEYGDNCKDITNCPAKYFIFADEMKCSEYGGNCKDITNCTSKRIVDKCHKATHEDLVITAGYNKTACEVAAIYGRADLAQEILQLLEIEEVGE